MPDQLQSIVQRMIDAGESEENIATVIKGYKPPAPESMGRQLARSALDALPGAGAIVGGVLSTPETLGAGTVAGMALGAGAGRGARDLIGHYTGLDKPSSPLDKAVNIGGETALAAFTGKVVPGLAEVAKAPLQTLREGAEQVASGLPQSVRMLGRMIPSAPKTGPTRLPLAQFGEEAAPPVTFNDRPLYQQMEHMGESARPPIQVSGSAAESLAAPSKPKLSAQDMVKWRLLTDQGVSPETAFKLVVKQEAPKLSLSELVDRR